MGHPVHLRALIMKSHYVLLQYMLWCPHNQHYKKPKGSSANTNFLAEHIDNQRQLLSKS